VHQTLIIQELLQEMGIESMNWPPYSPDLNPIEKLWTLMKQEIYRLYSELEHAHYNAHTLEALKTSAKEAWEDIRDRILVRLSQTMPHRVQAVIAADGWYTKILG
jgi:transposase